MKSDQYQFKEQFLTLHLPLLHNTTATTLFEISFIENGVHFPPLPSESTETQLTLFSWKIGLLLPKQRDL